MAEKKEEKPKVEKSKKMSHKQVLQLAKDANKKAKEAKKGICSRRKAHHPQVQGQEECHFQEAQNPIQKSQADSTKDRIQEVQQLRRLRHHQAPARLRNGHEANREQQHTDIHRRYQVQQEANQEGVREAV